VASALLSLLYARLRTTRENLMKRPVVLLSAAVLFAMSVSSSAQNPTLKSAMRDKVTSTRGLLEAVVAADYAAIGRTADALSRISETEIVSWQSAVQTEYLKQANQFVLSVRDLREASMRRDLEGVLAAYTTLAASCTRCHAHVRRSRTVSFDR
jgi:cytochrome c556